MNVCKSVDTSTRPEVTWHTFERTVGIMPHPPKLVKAEWQLPMANYIVDEDTITMPCVSAFDESNLSLNALVHELIHSTGHATRLNRHSVMLSDGYGGTLYAREELIATIGAFMICSKLDILSLRVREFNISCMNSWLSVLKDDADILERIVDESRQAVEYIFCKSEQSTH